MSFVRDTSASQRARDVYRNWDESSNDSGFGSDLERKVALLSVHDADDVRKHDYVRAPSRAKDGLKKSRYRFDEDGETDIRNSARGRKSVSLEGITLQDISHVGVLGGGGYAKVDLVEVKGERFALKILNKKLIEKKKQTDHVVSEKDAMYRARSKFIPRLFRTFQTANHVFMLTEACMGGDLFSVLEHHGALPYDVTRYVTSCIIEALDHLHRVIGFVHRDVKTENVLIDSHGIAKLGDLGFCKQLPRDNDATFSFCGTAGYVAPEILMRTGHGRASDFFSTGVVMFEITTCRSPFRRQSNADTHRATIRGINDVAFPQYVTDATVHIIRSLCVGDPRQRLGADGCEQVRRHQFFHGYDWDQLRHGQISSPLSQLICRRNEAAATSHAIPLSPVGDEQLNAVWSKHF